MAYNLCTDRPTLLTFRYRLDICWRGDWEGAYRNLKDYEGQQRSAVRGLLLIADEFERGILLDHVTGERSPPLLQLEKDQYVEQLLWREGKVQHYALFTINLRNQY